jgi:FkbM family methyltransferase
MSDALTLYRRVKIIFKQVTRVEPVIRQELDLALEFHGNAYCGWSIPANSLGKDAVVVDIGLGDDISFSESLISRYGCAIHGFDATPKSVRYLKDLRLNGFFLHEFCVGATRTRARFYLPNNEAHISGSLTPADHVGGKQLELDVIPLRDVFRYAKADRIDLLKMDIEGAEYSVIDSLDFQECAQRIAILCVEFHHRWRLFGRPATEKAVKTLRDLGFACAWRSPTTNEEFTFVNRSRAEVAWPAR